MESQGVNYGTILHLPEKMNDGFCVFWKLDSV